MAQSNSDNWKTPLGVYERAIREITKAREDIEVELQKLKTLQSSELKTLKAEFELYKPNHYQEQIENLKNELQITKDRLGTVQKIADDVLASKEVLKEEIHFTKERLAIAEKTAENTQKQIDSFKAEIKNQNQALRIEHGVWEGTAGDTPGWSILEGKGERTFRTYIRFYQGFLAAPNVIVGLSYFDIIRKANSRLNAKVAEVDPNGFYLDLYTCLNSQIWAAGVNWVAYGY